MWKSKFKEEAKNMKDIFLAIGSPFSNVIIWVAKHMDQANFVLKNIYPSNVLSGFFSHMKDVDEAKQQTSI